MKISRGPQAATTLALVALLTLGGCSASPGANGSAVPLTTATGSATSDAAAEECAGVSVVVDFGQLDAPSVTDCVDASAAQAANAVLQSAGVSTEGSVEWGDQIVCRVNDRPGAGESVTVAGETAFTETCAAMPPAFANWALWVKSAPSADWAYAQEGLGSLQVNAGESVGLVFTTGTDTPTPGS